METSQPVSIRLPTIDITGFGVGSTTSFNLKNVGLTAVPSIRGENKPILQIFNDSGVGFAAVTHTEQHGFNLPAGAWRNVALIAGEISVDFVAEYVLPNPPVSKLMATYYAPGETPDPIGTLGNSPIGGATQTSSIQTLSNEGAAAGTLVIDTGPATPGQVVSIFNDHFIWKVVTSLGVAHQVLAGNIASPFLQLGAAADLVEALGSLQVDASGDTITIANGAINIGARKVTVSGTSGTFTLYQLITGSVKLSVVKLFSLINNQASVLDAAFPQAYSDGAVGISTDLGVWGLKSAGSLRTISVITTLAVGGGSATGTTTPGQWSTFGLQQGFDTWEYGASQAGVRNGYVFLLGT